MCLYVLVEGYGWVVGEGWKNMLGGIVNTGVISYVFVCVGGRIWLGCW